MTILDESVPVLRHEDGTLEVWVLRDGVSGSVLLPPGTWSEETRDDDIAARIALEN